MKRILTAILCLSLMLGTLPVGVGAETADGIQIKINGTLCTFDQMPVMW